MGLDQRDQGGTPIGLHLSIAQDQDKRAMGRLHEKPEELSVMEKERAQSFGNGKGPEAVGDGREDIFDQILDPKEEPFLMARRAEQPGLTRKRDNLSRRTTGARKHGDAFARIATDRKTLNAAIDTRPEEAVCGLISGRVGFLKTIVMIVKDAVERALIKNPRAVFDGNPLRTQGRHIGLNSNNRAQNENRPTFLEIGRFFN
jgi:hypothetical protein